MEPDRSTVLTEEHALHLGELLEVWNRLASTKYYKGAQEHGGHLLDKAPLWLLDEAINENIDQFVYLYTLRQKLTELRNLEGVNPDGPAFDREGR